MNSLSTALAVFACIFGGCVVGMALRGLLPSHHLSADSKDTIKLGTGLIGTMAALVLGLMVSSAKSSFDTKRDEVIHLSADALFLDRLLSHFGPEARDARALLRQTVVTAIGRLWPESAPPATTSLPTAAISETLYDRLNQLPATTDAQRMIASQAREVLADSAKTRMLLYEQKLTSISVPFLAVVVSWLSIMFISFGLFAPRNLTVVITLLLCAFSVSGAIFLVLELDRPFEGLIQISSAPLQEALTILGR